jgi:hypothetical protein
MAVSGNPQVNRLAASATGPTGRRVVPRVSPFGRAGGGRSDTMGPVTTGKRAGARRAASPSPRSRLSPAVLAICAGITLCAVAWGYLVSAAVDFGTAARASGAGSSWAFMGLASLGAIACLFVGLLLVARLLQALTGSSSSSGARPPGGKRAAR